MIRTGTLEEAFQVFIKVPELNKYLTLSEMKQRAGNHAIVLIYEVTQCLAGFKIGYPLDETTFYSWLGGVIPTYRKNGAAQKMLTMQEELAKRAGFKSVQVKTMNQFRGMLHLLINNSYDIVRVEQYGNSENERIVLQKSLVTSN